MRRNAQISTKNAFGLFVGKVTLLLAMTGAALAAWALRGVLLILFGAIVLAVGMSAIASLLANKFRIGYSAGLSIVVLTGLVLIGAIGWFLGAAIGEQLDELTRKIPTGVQWLNDQIEARPYARDLLAKLQTADLSGPTGWIASALAQLCDCRWPLPDRLLPWP
jgi:predicted PurR-regulated permease PerM